jgi:hypothetical protein
MGLRGRTMPLLMELGNWFHRILQRCRPDGAGPPLWRGGAYHRALAGPRYCPRQGWFCWPEASEDRHSPKAGA